MTATSDPLPTYHGLVRRDAFDLIPAKAGRILDLGGGIGATSSALKSEGRADHVTLLDLVAQGAADGIDVAVAGNLDDLAFLRDATARHGPFDTILCLDILEHLYDPWQTVKILDTSLSPGGSIIISLPNVNYIGLVGPLVLRGRFELADAGVMDRTHIRWFAKHGAIELASCSGLRVEAIKANVFGRRKRLIDRLTLGGLTRFLASQYILRARKSA